MAIAKTHNPKFKWEDHNLEELKREYYEIGLTEFKNKYNTGNMAVFRNLWYLPPELKNRRKPSYSGKLKTRLERLENTTKVARLYEKKMKELEPPKYEWPWAYLFNKQIH